MAQLLHSKSLAIDKNNYQKIALDDHDGWAVTVAKVAYLANYRLQLTFDDGHVQVVDFEPFLRQTKHPDMRQYLDVARFKQFTLEDGELFWHDYTLCFPIFDLYRGTI